MTMIAPIATARATKPISQSVPSRPFRSFAVEVARAPSRGAAEAATGAATIADMAKAYSSFAGSFIISLLTPIHQTTDLLRMKLEERRIGNECYISRLSRGSPFPYKHTISNQLSNHN